MSFLPRKTLFSPHFYSNRRLSTSLSPCGEEVHGCHVKNCEHNKTLVYNRLVSQEWLLLTDSYSIVASRTDNAHRNAHNDLTRRTKIQLSTKSRTALGRKVQVEYLCARNIPNKRCQCWYKYKQNSIFRAEALRWQILVYSKFTKLLLSSRTRT